MYYGWVIVAATFIGMGFQAGFYAYAFSLFVVPWQEAFAADRASVMLSMTLSTFIGLVSAPVIGKLVDRVSARALLSTGAAVHTLGFYLMSIATELWHLIAAFGVFMSIGTQLLGNMASGATVSRWFTTSRGKALGISTIGTSIGGMVFPIFVGQWIAEDGWRSALQFLAVGHAIIVLPMMLALIRQPPVLETGLSQVGAGEQEWTMPILLRNRNFWSLVPSIGMLMAVYAAVLANLSPYGASIALSEAESARMITVVAFAGIVGKLMFGVLSDRISLKIGLWSAQALVALAVLMMALVPGPMMAMLAAVALGLAAGGLLPVSGAMVAKLFGTVSFGRVMGLMTPFTIILVMPGFTLAGALYDLRGDYTLCFLIFAGLLGLGALAAVPLTLPEEPAAS